MKSDILQLQMLREHAEAAAADGPNGEVYVPGQMLVDLLDDFDELTEGQPW